MNGTFNFTFSMLIKNNPALKNKEGTMFFDKDPVGQIGELNFIKVDTMIIASFFLDDFGKDVVMFDISSSIGKDTHFSFNFDKGKVAHIFVYTSDDEGEVKFVRCPK